MSKIKYPQHRRQEVFAYRNEKLIRDVEAQESRNAYIKQKKELQASESYIKGEARRIILQNLDKANKNASPEQKISNTLKFFNEVLNGIKQDYETESKNGNLQRWEIAEIIKGYCVHIKILRKFDKETELNEALGYNRPLTEHLKEELNNLNPEFMLFADLEVIEMLSL